MKFFRKLLVALAILLAGDLNYCLANQEGQQMKYDNLQEVPEKDWDALQLKKIFFGHQSVGANILNGIDLVMKDDQKIKLVILSTINPNDFDGSGIFAHNTIGENFIPQSKIEAFSEIIEDKIGVHINIAFMKFCYVDIGTTTDTEELFQDYRRTFSRLKKTHPHIKFVHVTVPLVVEPTGVNKWKVKIIRIIKKIMGKYDFDENITKNKYNELIRNEYEGREPIFDLAKVESTYPDGSRELFIKNGQEFYSLVPSYTNDGGHLNIQGQKTVAEKLLLFLLEL